MTGDQTVEYYRKRAGEYDQIYFRDEPARQAELAALYAISRRVLAGRCVIDLACGTGFWTKILSEMAVSITGLDINKTVMDLARDKRYLCPVSFVRGDVYALPFAPGAFDGLAATFLLSHLKRQEMAWFGETAGRLVAPKTPAFACDNNPPSEILSELIWDNERINSYRKRRLANGEEYLILKNYFTADELADRLGRWGKIEMLVFKNYYWGAVLTLNP
jgi:ubiquinone/menaquinone biosynthesis C-methylase UbiE